MTPEELYRLVMRERFGDPRTLEAERPTVVYKRKAKK